jgi:hypothetical protein
MTDQAAYRRYAAEAERLARLAEIPWLVKVPSNITEEQADAIADQFTRHIGTASVRYEEVPEPIITPLDIDVSPILAAAQVYATLALAAAQDRVQPADRPIDDDPDDVEGKFIKQLAAERKAGRAFDI